MDRRTDGQARPVMQPIRTATGRRYGNCLIKTPINNDTTRNNDEGNAIVY